MAQPYRLLFKLLNSRMVEVTGISSVGVKSVDIRRNTDGVGSTGPFLTLRHESVGSEPD